MEVKSNKIEKTLIISVNGRIDSLTATEFEKEVDLIGEDIKELIFDFGNLEYTSSAGLRVILKAQKIMNEKGSLVVKNANENIKEIFEITGFADILNIE